MRRQSGFTIIELLVTIVIISVLASAALPMAELVQQRTKEQELRRALLQIREAIDAYHQAAEAGRIERNPGASGYPPSLEVLVDGVIDAKDPARNKLYFLRRIPRDPMHQDRTLTPGATWGKRSYRSSAEQPREGEDVYDVYSLQTGTALNGSAYRDW